MKENVDLRVARVVHEVALPTVSVLRLEGEHDLASAPKVREAIASELGEGRNVVIDVTQTLFMDLSILRTLTKARESAQASGQRVVFQFGTTPTVRRLLEVTALVDQFPYESSREQAVQAAAGGDLGES